MLKNGWEDNKLAKLGDAIAISKSETMKDSLTDRGRCSEMLSHLKSTLITPAISTALHSGLLWPSQKTIGNSHNFISPLTNNCSSQANYLSSKDLYDDEDEDEDNDGDEGEDDNDDDSEDDNGNVDNDDDIKEDTHCRWCWSVFNGYPNPTRFPVFFSIPDPIQFWKSSGSG